MDGGGHPSPSERQQKKGEEGQSGKSLFLPNLLSVPPPTLRSLSTRRLLIQEIRHGGILKIHPLQSSLLCRIMTEASAREYSASTQQAPFLTDRMAGVMSLFLGLLPLALFPFPPPPPSPPPPLSSLISTTVATLSWSSRASAAEVVLVESTGRPAAAAAAAASRSAETRRGGATYEKPRKSSWAVALGGTPGESGRK